MRVKVLTERKKIRQALEQNSYLEADLNKLSQSLEEDNKTLEEEKRK